MLSLYLLHPIRIVFNFYLIQYKKEWDETLTEWLDSDASIEVKNNVMVFHFQSGETAEVWVSNRWYSYGSCYEVNGKSVDIGFRPSLNNMARLYKIQRESMRQREAKGIDLFQKVNTNNHQ